MFPTVPLLRYNSRSPQDEQRCTKANRPSRGICGLTPDANGTGVFHFGRFDAAKVRNSGLTKASIQQPGFTGWWFYCRPLPARAHAQVTLASPTRKGSERVRFVVLYTGSPLLPSLPALSAEQRRQMSWFPIAAVASSTPELSCFPDADVRRFCFVAPAVPSEVGSM
jgi:hypothetical protein